MCNKRNEKAKEILRLVAKSTVSTHEALSSNVRDATYFVIAVMKCLLSSKWHAYGFLWCLEYLNFLVEEKNDFTVREQDVFYKINSLSIPENLNDLCALMGVVS